MITRREQREIAFTLVFEQTITTDDMKDIIDVALEMREEPMTDFTKGLAMGVNDNLEAIDEVINKYSKTWNTKRLSKVALSTLRLAVYEIMKDKNTPVSVSINEAVELTKKYGRKEDSNYVNGVLSSVSKDKEVVGEKKDA